MSILEREGRDREDITSGASAWELFTDHEVALCGQRSCALGERHELTRRFAQYLNEEPAPEKILFFYGDGGNGKSFLYEVNKRVEILLLA